MNWWNAIDNAKWKSLFWIGNVWSLSKLLWDFYYFPRGIYDNSIVILAFVVLYHTVFDTEIKYSAIKNDHENLVSRISRCSHDMLECNRLKAMLPESDMDYNGASTAINTT